MKLFYGGGLCKYVGQRQNMLRQICITKVGQRQSILKLHWLKHLKTVLKNRILDQKTDDPKPHIWSLSSIVIFTSRKPQSQQKIAKNITHFTIQFCSKDLTRFANLNSLDAENNTIPQHSQKPFWLKNFPANIFLSGVRKNICTAPFFDAQELDS